MTVQSDDPTKTAPVVVEDVEPTGRLPDNDVDVIAEKAALKALADAEAAGGEGEKAKPNGDAAKPAPKVEPEAITIPKARLDQEIEKNRKLELEAARLEGALAAAVELRKENAAEAEDEKIQLTPEQVDAHFDTMREALAKKLDDAEITNADAFREERRIEKLRNIALDELERRSQPEPEEDPEPAESLALAGATSQIVEGRPWVEKVTTEDWEALKPLAHRLLKNEGIVLGTDEQSTIYLRAALIRVAEQYGLDKQYGGDAKPAAVDGFGKPVNGAAKPTTKADGTPLDPKDVAAKIALAKAQPGLPEGSPGGSDGDVDPATVRAEQDLDALPQSTKDRILASILG